MTLVPGKKLALSIAVLVLGYALLEAVVYLVYRPAAVLPANAPQATVTAEDLRPGRERAGLGFRDPSMTLHPFLGYVFLPNDQRGEAGGMGIDISDEGFLDAGSSLRKRAEGRLVIGLTGGSVAGQLGVHYAKHLTDALKALPELHDLELDLVWLGMPGYHQPQQVIQLSYLLAQGGEFDVFINLDGFNEIAVGPVLNVPQGTHPLFPMNWSMVALDVPDVRFRRYAGAIDHLTRERNERAERFLASSWSWSPFAKLLRSRDDERLRGRIDDYANALREVPVDEIPWFVSGPEADHLPLEELMPRSVAVWEQCSRQLDALCMVNDIRYVHVLQPNQYDPGSKPLSSEELESAFDEDGAYRPAVELGYPLLRAAGLRLKEAGIDFHDLSQVFAGIDDTLYTDVCCHFNGEGNRVLAEEIAKAVRDAL